MKVIVALVAALFVFTTTASAQFDILKPKADLELHRNATRTLFKPYMLPSDSIVPYIKKRVTVVQVADDTKSFNFKTKSNVFVMKKMNEGDEKGYVAQGSLVDVTDSFIVLKCTRYAIDHGSNKPSAAYLKIPWNDIEFMGVLTPGMAMENTAISGISAAAGAAASSYSGMYTTFGHSGIGGHKTLRMKTEWVLSTVETL